MERKLPKILAVVGPTCSGKTGTGIALAKRFDGEVICADSRTVYKGMDIGTAKPEADDVSPPIYGGSRRGAVDEGDSALGIDSLFAARPRLVEGVPHWGIDLVNPDEVFTVSQFQEYADKKITEILERGHVPILVGGTGMYIRAIIDRPNYANTEPDAALRSELESMTDNELLEEIASRDPDAASTIDDRNRRRLVRALEILRTTGKTLADRQEFADPIYDALQIGVTKPREQLYADIDLRVDEMIGKGLVDEVRKLRDLYGDDCPGMTGIGYRQIVDFFQKKEQLRDAVLRIKYDSHHYAKRQETWFQRDSRILWVTSVYEAVKISDNFFKR
ncbi:MAG: tRNA (adenosine(37)-N6)-dimethylallyltransferase MiaA [Patescibacteria group bacterium]